MAEYIYQRLDDGTNCAMKYTGNDSEVIIPDNEKISILFDDLFKELKCKEDKLCRERRLYKIIKENCKK